MHNLVLSPIDPEKLISSISERVTANILKAVRNEQPTPNQPEQLLTIQEAAQFLSLTVPTMYNKVSKGALPVMKRGKRLYFSRTELMEYVGAGRKKSKAEPKHEAKKSRIIRSFTNIFWKFLVAIIIKIVLNQLQLE